MSLVVATRQLLNLVIEIKRAKPSAEAMLSTQERCALLTVGARLSVIPVRTAVIFLEPHGRHPHMRVSVTRDPELLEHEAMAGAAWANPPCTTTSRGQQASLCLARLQGVPAGGGTGCDA